jgi:protein-disulfide isomerase
MSLFRSLVIVAALMVSAGGSVAQQATPAFPEDLREAVREMLIENPRVLEVLSRHPEIVAEAVQQMRKQEAARRAALAESRKALLEDGVSFVAGNPKGDVTIVEFFDYRCPYCKQVLPSLEALLKEDRGLRVVFKEYPVLGPDSVIAARAAVAAMEQDRGAKYFAFHSAMMSHRGQINEAEVMRFAAAAGLKLDRLKADMATPKTEKVLSDNHALAEKLGIQGTPGFVIGDQIVPGAVPLESLRQLVKAARG